MQSYDGPRGAIVHADFYRLSGAQELVELGWDEATDTAITLVEWPERAESALKATRLDIDLDLATAQGPMFAWRCSRAPAGSRRASSASRVSRPSSNARAGPGPRTHLQGDASTRAYERLVKPDGETAILMISPARPDGPPVRRGKPYSAIAKLAESVHAFVAVDRGLRALGLSAPRIYGEDLEAGLLLIEDLGNEPVVDRDGPIPERYGEATRLLAKLHTSDVPPVLPVSQGRDHAIPPFDLEALLIEVELLVDWYVPHIVGSLMSASARAEFVNLWSECLTEVLAGPTTWTLRDYHSPNLIWLPDRQGIQRVGLIDFQDAVLGHPAYDVARSCRMRESRCRRSSSSS